MLLSNAFSLNMLADLNATVQITVVSRTEAIQILNESGMTSAVGHADTAAVFATVLGRDVPANRISVSLAKGEGLMVGQYRGPRLPEGATQLPEGATIQWCLVSVR